MEGICPRCPLCCGRYAACRSQPQPPNRIGRVRDVTSPPLLLWKAWQTFQLIGRTFPSGLVSLCGEDDGIWNLRSAIKSAMRIGGPEPKTRLPTQQPFVCQSCLNLGFIECVRTNWNPQNLHATRAPNIISEDRRSRWAFSCLVPHAGFALVEFDSS